MGLLDGLFRGRGINVSVIDHPPCQLGESPLWCEQYNVLYWIDIPVGNIWRYNLTTQQTSLFWSAGEPVGAVTLNHDRHLIVFAVSGVYLLKEKSGIFTKIRLFDTNFKEGERFNDCYTDAYGRVYAGTLQPNSQQGRMIVYEKNKKQRVLLENLRVSNGMAVSHDHKYFYHVDSGLGTITRYQFDINLGQLVDSNIFFQLKQNNGSPDGMQMDEEGCLWIACWNGNKIIRINQQGKLIDTIRLKEVCPTSVCFGGEDLSTIFITTTRYQKYQTKKSGQVLQVKVRVRGLKANLSRF